ncbi:hypothetical protein ACROYT_G004337 [Oculina patagonica]
MFGDGVLFFIVCLATPNVITATNTTTHQLPTVAGTASSSMVTPAPEPGPDWPVAKQQWGHTWELHWIGMAIAFAILACRSLWAIFSRTPDVNSSGTRVVIKTRNIRNRICEMVNAEWNLQGLQSKSAERRAAEKEPSCEKKETARQPSTPQNDHNRGGPKVAYTIQPLGFGNNLTVGALGTKHKVPSQGPKQAKGQRQPKATFGPTGRERAIQNIASITVITSILSISCCALQLYSLFGVYGAYSKIMSPKPWPWMAFQTSFRFVELILAFMLSHCVLRSRPGWRRNILTRLFNRRRTRKTQAPHVITIVQVKDAFQERLA